MFPLPELGNASHYGHKKCAPPFRFRPIPGTCIGCLRTRTQATGRSLQALYKKCKRLVSALLAFCWRGEAPTALSLRPAWRCIFLPYLRTEVGFGESSVPPSFPKPGDGPGRSRHARVGQRLCMCVASTKDSWRLSRSSPLKAAPATLHTAVEVRGMETLTSEAFSKTADVANHLRWDFLFFPFVGRRVCERFSLLQM
jgi:hypothetical protein